jgi:hypothetical protein
MMQLHIKFTMIYDGRSTSDAHSETAYLCHGHTVTRIRLSPALQTQQGTCWASPNREKTRDISWPFQSVNCLGSGRAYSQDIPGSFLSCTKKTSQLCSELLREKEAGILGKKGLCVQNAICGSVPVPHTQFQCVLPGFMLGVLVAALC